MTIRELSKRDAYNLVIGAKIFACGGGGSEAKALENIKKIYDNASPAKKVNLEEGWKILEPFKNIRFAKDGENLEILAKVHARFIYDDKTSFEGLKALIVEGSPASKQNLIDGLAKADKAFNSEWDLPIVFSGIKKGEVKVIAVIDGENTEVARVDIDNKLVKKKFLNEEEGVEVAGKYEGDVILRKGKEVGFKLYSAEDMHVKLKKFPDLQKSFDELDDILKPQFVEDFAGATDDILKKVKDENLFDAWKNNVRSADLDILRNSISNSGLRHEYDGLVTALAS